MTNYVLWCCDYDEGSGEGQLARQFVKKKFKLKKIKLLKPAHRFLFSDYIYPFYGIFILWLYFFKSKKIVYINYLPLWNFLIFLLAPPSTTFGPLTGSVQINKISGIKSLIRFYLFPKFYKLSLLILKKRNCKLVFASNILLKFLDKKQIKNSEMNFIFKNAKIKKLKKRQKKFFLIIYYRNHENKFFKHHFVLIKKLLKQKKKILVFGDEINILNIKSLGKLKKKQILKFINQSKYTLSGDDNLLSIFNIECLSNNVRVIYNKKLNYQVPKSKKELFIPYDYENTKLNKISIF